MNQERLILIHLNKFLTEEAYDIAGRALRRIRKLADSFSTGWHM